MNKDAFGSVANHALSYAGSIPGVNNWLLPQFAMLEVLRIEHPQETRPSATSSGPPGSLGNVPLEYSRYARSLEGPKSLPSCSVYIRGAVRMKSAIAETWGWVYRSLMTKSQIESAILSGVPFILRMADGREYEVPHRDYISLSPKGTFATVYDEEEHYFVLPLLTMTGLVSTIPKVDGGSQKE